MIGFCGCITCFVPRVIGFNILMHIIYTFMCVCVYLLKVERRIDLVYGGGSVGLMGLVSQAVHDGGRHVLGYVVCTPQYIYILIFSVCIY